MLPDDIGSPRCLTCSKRKIPFCHRVHDGFADGLAYRGDDSLAVLNLGVRGEGAELLETFDDHFSVLTVGGVSWGHVKGIPGEES